MRLDSVVHPLPYNERFYIGCAIDSFLLVAIRICVDRIHDILSKISLVFLQNVVHCRASILNHFILSL